MKKIVSVGIIVAFFLVLSCSGFFWFSFVNKPATDHANEIIYEIGNGFSFRAIAKDLEQRGLVKNANLFLIFARIKNQAGKVKSGEYLLNTNMTPNEVLAIITSGKSIERKITIAEGLNIFEVAQVLKQAGICTEKEFMKIILDSEFIQENLHEKQSSLEGYLFPETYGFTKYTDCRKIIQEMVTKFKQVFLEVQVKNNFPQMSRHEITTLASIIEKETGASSERTTISSVFHNRLKKGMMLQTDPTVLYGKELLSGKIETNITKADLLKPTPYNSYTNKGLPPGPIANPGKEAMLAAVTPKQTNYLYFVSHNDGTTEFSVDYAAHQKAVQKYQLDPKARTGKSWRNLKTSSH